MSLILNNWAKFVMSLSRLYLSTGEVAPIQHDCKDVNLDVKIQQTDLCYTRYFEFEVLLRFGRN